MTTQSDPNEQLAIAAAQGDGEAWLALCKQFEPFVIKTARKFYRGVTSMAEEDLKQEAYIIVFELCRSWRPGSGTKFSSYLITWLPNHLQRLIDANDRMVKTPPYMASQQRMARKEGRPVPGTVVVMGHAQIEHIVGLGMEDIDDDSRAEGVANADEMSGSNPLIGAQVAELFGFFSRLDDRTQQVMALYLAWDIGFYEIGEIVGLSHQGAANVFDNGITQLRLMMGISADINLRYRQTKTKRLFGEDTQSVTLDDKSALRAA